MATTSLGKLADGTRVQIVVSRTSWDMHLREHVRRFAGLGGRVVTSNNTLANENCVELDYDASRQLKKTPKSRWYFFHFDEVILEQSDDDNVVLG